MVVGRLGDETLEEYRTNAGGQSSDKSNSSSSNSSSNRDRGVVVVEVDSPVRVRGVVGSVDDSLCGRMLRQITLHRSRRTARMKVVKVRTK